MAEVIMEQRTDNPIPPTATIWPTATVSRDVVIKDYALVFGNAKVLDFAVLEFAAKVADYAVVRGWARIGPYSIVDEHAEVCDKAVIDRALVCGRARVGGNAFITPHAIIRGDAVIEGDEDFVVIGELTGHGHVTAHRDGVIGVRVNWGAFSGTIEEFENKVAHREYMKYPRCGQMRAAIELIKEKFL